VAGGTPLDRAGYFYPPTIVDCVTDDMPVVAEEQFGPVIPVLTFRDEDEAILRANNSPYGLTASVWSADQESAYRLAARLDCGQVSVHTHSGGLRMDLPFSGRKWIGIGVENGIWGYYGFTEPQVITGPGREEKHL
jgi:acyl-CoA reductase-like NAD-dependent aldehyde dehydrogenase